MHDTSLYLCGGTILLIIWIVLVTQGYILPKASEVYGLKGSVHRGATICDLGVNMGKIAIGLLLIQCFFCINYSTMFFKVFAPAFTILTIMMAYSMNQNLFEYLIPAFVAEIIIIYFANSLLKVNGG